MSDFIIEKDPGRLYRVVGGRDGGHLYRLAATGDGWEHVREASAQDVASWRPHAQTGADAANLRKLPIAVGAA